MQAQRYSFSQRGVLGFLALWLGLLLPLLCVPGLSSTHTHGIHWVWEQGGVETEATSAHTHEHTHTHGKGHEHTPSTTIASATTGQTVSSYYPTLNSNQIPTAELLMNLFGMMEPLPTGGVLAALVGLVLLLGSGWLFRAVHPLPSPWNPPKVYS